MTTPNRPPSCDLPPEFYEPRLKPCPLCGFSNTEVLERTIGLRGYCPACQMQGPDRATEIYAIQSWNAIPRRSEVLELIRLVDECNNAETQQYHNALFIVVRNCADKLRKEMGE